MSHTLLDAALEVWTLRSYYDIVATNAKVKI